MRLLLSTLCAAGALSLTSCQTLTSVDAPDVVQAEDYGTPAGATALAVRAVTQFHTAFGGSLARSQVGQSALMADELTVTASNAAGREWDSRDPQDPANVGVDYTPLHDARQRLLDAIGSFQRLAPDSSARIGQLFALLGYTSVFFGETYCAGVPLSHRDADLRPVYGQPLPTAQLFDSALTAFDSALVYGADDARIADLARVGRARALLNLGRFSDAAQAVVGVPTTYVYNATYLAVSPLNNGFFAVTGTPLWHTSATVPNQEGTNGLNWQTANDPRVPLISRPAVGASPAVWGFVPYQAANAPIRLAGGVEARLIEAEAALQAGDATTWLAIHNALRATVTWPVDQPATLSDPGTEAGRVDLHFRERAFWLFLTGRRHNDLRRLVRQYGRGAETIFPTGHWRDGVSYGSVTNMAPPAEQLRNPHYTGCLNRDA